MRKIPLTIALVCLLSSSLAGSQTQNGSGGANPTPPQARTAARPLTSDTLPKGQVIERVVCRTDARQSYALYIPSGYTPARKWPILYAFDPLARGRVPVELFREAAEKYGWVVVGSNNSRNGHMNIASDAVKAVWPDTHERLSIDDRRVYMTGFSGGARVASFLGAACGNCVAGVIACGAGLHPDVQPSATLPFIFFGTVGTNDFNFPELKMLDESLSKLRVTHRVVLFDGAHEWAPAALATEAVEWMEIQAIKSGRRERDDALINELWKKGLERARGLEASGKFYDAYKNYESLSLSFKGLVDVAEVERSVARLRDADEVKKALRDESDQVRRQQQMTNQLNSLVAGRTDPDSRYQNSGAFKQIIGDLKKSAREMEDSGERRVARRILNATFAQYYETGTLLLESRRDYDRAVFNLEIASEVATKSPQVFFDLARAYALSGDRKKAIQSLRTAVELGFTDSGAITNESALDSLRNEAAFREIVEGLKNRH